LWRANILIAEDDTTLRNIYEKKFTLNGYDIRTVTNGEEAIAEIEKQEPDLLILDINMPIMDGFGVLEKLKGSNPPYPVIMLTNFADEETKKRGMELGADAYFVKSEMTMKTLMQMVKTLLKAGEHF